VYAASELYTALPLGFWYTNEVVLTPIDTSIMDPNPVTEKADE
jgi:hypothetical protein